MTDISLFYRFTNNRVREIANKENFRVYALWLCIPPAIVSFSDNLICEYLAKIESIEYRDLSRFSSQIKFYLFDK